MKLIKPSVELLEQGPGLQGIYDMIELCGKTSYKSPVKGGDEAKKFVEARINEGHYAVLEFGTVYLKIPAETWREDRHEWEYMFPEDLPWVDVNCDGIFYYITTNFRHIIERSVGMEIVEQSLCDPTPAHLKRYCARFITDRGVSHELVRHRSMSFVQESTRYCNYSKDKFGNELTFIIPSWAQNLREGNFDDTLGLDFVWSSTDDGEPLRCNNQEACFMGVLNKAESCYMESIQKYGLTPQQARQILPNALKTEVCMCGFEDDWKHFFDLRYRGTTGKPHPDMLQVATMLHNEFEKRGISL